jgi:hypothetical protein
MIDDAKLICRPMMITDVTCTVLVVPECNANACIPLKIP